MHLLTELYGLDIVLCVDLPFCPVKGQRILLVEVVFLGMSVRNIKFKVNNLC